MTPLQVYARILARRRRVDPPSTEDAAEIRRWIKRHVRGQREREIANYMIRAADGRLGEKGGRGSLKYILWWLRDHAGQEYPAAARGVIEYLIKHPRIPLDNIMTCLECIPAVAPFVDDLRQGVNGADLAKRLLKVHRAGRWSVAVNCTSLNLTSVAMKHTPADLYAAASERGAVVKARRGSPFPMQELQARLAPDWIRPYPDLILLRRAAGEQELERILEAVGDIK
ncbi:MAG TPA: hypothetical protein EYH30_10725 [Anaerolineales bacterium]|nr:hypothetical protein [Anaerolineae bacterium]HIQ02573.1 hypothetical protein [Anaerolineales bacterium]